MKTYDAIVIGGGINSLTAASILAKEGLSVALFEAKENIGGISGTRKFLDSFTYNMIYDYVSWIDPRLIKYLQLDEYGLELFSPYPLKIVLDSNGKHLSFYCMNMNIFIFKINFLNIYWKKILILSL